MTHNNHSPHPCYQQKSASRDGEHHKRTEIVNKLWLHARHAALFVQWVNRFKSTITIWKGEQKFSRREPPGVLCSMTTPSGNATRVMFSGLKGATFRSASHRANGAPRIAQYSWTCP
jgi:phosphotransferase system HPr-like phosphotransfer protein